MRRLSLCSTGFTLFTFHQGATIGSSSVVMLALTLPASRWSLTLRARFSGRHVPLGDRALGRESPAIPWPQLATSVDQMSNR
jgi:hypothetical protein